MTYIKVSWKHSFENEPVEMLSELNFQRMEIRKVERFPNGTLSFAGSAAATGPTQLSESPLPPLEIIALDPQFALRQISRDEFELAWRAATVAVAA